MNNGIVFGLTAIKGLGRGAAEEIVRARDEGGPFKDLFDFCERVDRRIVHEGGDRKADQGRGVRLLRQTGTRTFARRRQGAASAADERAPTDKPRPEEHLRHVRRREPTTSGADAERADQSTACPTCAEWPDLDKLKYEKEALDFYISSHPLAQYDEQLRRFRTHDARRDGQGQGRHRRPPRRHDREPGGPHREQGSEHGPQVRPFRVEDFTGSVRCVLWSDEYTRFQSMVTADAVHLFEGTLNWAPERAEPDFQVKKVMTSDEARAEFTKSMLIKFAYSDDEGSLRKLDAVSLVLKRYRGSCPVYLSIRDANGKQVQLKLNEEFRVNPGALKVEELEMVLGAGAVLFSR